MSLFRRVGLLVAGAIVSSVLVALPVAPAHADYDLTVTWPAATSVNPDVIPYAITVADTGPGDLQAVWDGAAQPIPHQGTVTLDLPTEGVGHVLIQRCNGGTCASTGVLSPTLSVCRHFGLEVQATAKVAGDGSVTVSPILSVAVPTGMDNVFTFDWRLLAGSQPGDPELDSGSETSPYGWHSWDIQLPPGLSSGTYGVEVTVSSDLGGGLVTSDPVIGTFVVDAVAPTVDVTVDRSVIYPVNDDYLDELPVSVVISEKSDLRLRVTAQDGSITSVVDTELFAPANKPRSLVWAGKLKGALPPAGDYWLDIEATDSVGNKTVVRVPATADLAAKQTRAVTRTVTAKASTVDTFVGRCSQLASPSSHRWKGSLGYYSKSRCKSNGRAAEVISAHAVTLPDAFLGDYPSVRVYAYGGKSKGVSRSYLLFGYYFHNGKAGEGIQIPANLGWHGGWKGRGGDYVAVRPGQPAVMAWWVGLTGGARYDVRSFKVKATRTLLVEPSGQVVWPTATKSRVYRGRGPASTPAAATVPVAQPVAPN